MVDKANANEAEAQAVLSAAHLELADARRAVLLAQKNGNDAAIATAQSAIKPLEEKVETARKAHDQASAAFKVASKLPVDSGE